MLNRTVPVTRQHLSDLLRAKCATERSRDNLGMSNTAGLSEDARIDLDLACYQADEAVVKARTAYQDALRAFDAQKTQQAVLVGSEPKGDAQLEAAVLGFTPEPAKCPACGDDDLETLPPHRADPESGVMHDHPGGRFCPCCCKWASVNEKSQGEHE